MKRNLSNTGADKKQEIPHNVIESMKPEDNRYLFVAYFEDSEIHYYTCPKLSARSEEDTWFLKSILAYSRTDPKVYCHEYNKNDPFDFRNYLNQGAAPMTQLIEMMHSDEELDDYFKDYDMFPYVDNIFSKFKGVKTRDSIKKLSSDWKVVDSYKLVDLTRRHHYVMFETNC